MPTIVWCSVCASLVSLAFWAGWMLRADQSERYRRAFFAAMDLLKSYEPAFDLLSPSPTPKEQRAKHS